MDYFKAIQAGINFVEDHLEESISLASVARAGNMSQWHFQRIFKALTKETLKTYIRSRRMALALDKLLNSELRILDIALLAGFESQESFTRAFKGIYDMTPTEFRKQANKNLFPKKAVIDPSYVAQLSHNAQLEPEIYWQPEMTLVGLKTSLFGVDSEKNNVGEKLPALWANFLARLDEVEQAIPGICYGTIHHHPDDPEQLEYHAAIAVEGIADIPTGMSAVVVPEQQYARFLHRGNPVLLNETIDYIYSNWLMNSDFNHTYGFDLEFYGLEYEDGSDQSIMYYAIPVDSKSK